MQRIILAFTLLVCLAASGGTKTWVGGTTVNEWESEWAQSVPHAYWGEGKNWDPEGVPEASDDVVFAESARVFLQPDTTYPINKLILNSTDPVTIVSATGNASISPAVIKTENPDAVLKLEKGCIVAPDSGLTIFEAVTVECVECSFFPCKFSGGAITVNGTLEVNSVGESLNRVEISSEVSIPGNLAGSGKFVFSGKTTLSGDNSGFSGIVESSTGVMHFGATSAGSENAEWHINGDVRFEFTNVESAAIKFGDLIYEPAWTEWGVPYSAIYDSNRSLMLEIGGRGGLSRLGKAVNDPVRFCGVWHEEGNWVSHPEVTLRKVGAGILELFAYDYVAIEANGGEVVQNALDLAGKDGRYTASCKVDVGAGGCFGGVASGDCPVSALTVASHGVVHPGTNVVVDVSGVTVTNRLGDIRVGTAEFASSSVLRFTPNAGTSEYAKIVPAVSAVLSDAVIVEVPEANRKYLDSAKAYDVVSANATGRVDGPAIKVSGWLWRSRVSSSGAASLFAMRPGVVIVVR